MASGEWLGAFCLSEPDAGSDPGAMRTRATKVDGGWKLNGAKNWITNSGVADVYVTFAVTDPDVKFSRGITAFAVMADADGFRIDALEKKMGMKGSPTGQPVYEDVFVPDEDVIGEVGKGFTVAMQTLDRSRLGIAAQAVGIAQGATDYAAEYAKERIAFGKPINQLQGIQFKLADMETKTAAARELLYKAASTGRDQRPEARQVLGHGQALRLRRGDGSHHRSGPGPRWLRLRPGVPGRANDARRQADPDLRRNQRDPARRNRPHPGVARAAPGTTRPTLTVTPWGRVVPR